MDVLVYRGVVFCVGTLLIFNTHGGNCAPCPVNAGCDCTPQNGTDITCLELQSSLPRFLVSNVYFRGLHISTKGSVTFLPGTFQNVRITSLTIGPTPMSSFGCLDFVGLEATLASLAFIGNPELTAVPTCALSTLSNLRALHFHGNGLTVLKRNDFASLIRLENLHLGWNKISTIEPGSFNGLVNLKTLGLDGNDLLTLDSSLFTELKLLRSLHIQNNKIQTLPETLFENTTSLKYLFLGDNKIPQLPQKLFSSSLGLTHLYAPGNKLSDIPQNLFKSTLHLRFLNLSSNHLSSFNPDVFRGLHQLETVSLSNNRNHTDTSVNSFETLFTDVSRYWPLIRSIYCSNNAIRTLPAGAFDNLASLRRLHLDHNELTEVPGGIFTNSPRLNYLELEDNDIINIDESVFENLGNQVRKLSLSGNRLSEASLDALLKSRPTLEGLRELHLSDMQLPPLSTDSVKSFGKLSILSLRNCSLNELTEFHGVSLPEKTDLSDNNLTTLGVHDKPVTITGSDVHLDVSNNFLRELDLTFSHDNISRVDVNSVQNQLEKVTLSAVAETTIQFFGLSHNHMANPLTVSNGITVDSLDLSNNAFVTITHFPLTIADPASGSGPCASALVNSLNLSQNAITDIAPGACFWNVETLDLSNNMLQVLGALMSATTTSPPRLRYLYLNGNQLESLSSNSLRGVSTFLKVLDLRSNKIVALHSLLTLLVQPNFQNLYVSDNPLDCDCDSAVVRDGITALKVDSARCESPPAAKYYLLQCYPLNSCHPSVTSSVSLRSSTRTQCQSDLFISVASFTVNTDDEDTAMLRWSVAGPGGRDLAGFRLTYTDPQVAGKATERVIPSGNTSAVLSNLICGHKYNVCLRTQTISGNSLSQMCSNVTLDQASCVQIRKTKPLAIGDLTTRVQNGSVVIIWSAVGLGAIHIETFHLEITDLFSDQMIKRVVPSYQRSLKFSGIQDGHKYNICVSALLNFGSSTGRTCTIGPMTAHVVTDETTEVVTGVLVTLVLCVLIGVIVCLVWKRNQLKACRKKRKNADMNSEEFHEHVDIADTNGSFFQPKTGRGQANGSNVEESYFSSDIYAENDLGSSVNKSGSNGTSAGSQNRDNGLHPSRPTQIGMSHTDSSKA